MNKLQCYFTHYWNFQLMLGHAHQNHNNYFHLKFECVNIKFIKLVYINMYIINSSFLDHSKQNKLNITNIELL